VLLTSSGYFVQVLEEGQSPPLSLILLPCWKMGPHFMMWLISSRDRQSSVSFTVTKTSVTLDMYLSYTITGWIGHLILREKRA